MIKSDFITLFIFEICTKKSYVFHGIVQFRKFKNNHEWYFWTIFGQQMDVFIIIFQIVSKNGKTNLLHITLQKPPRRVALTTSISFSIGLVLICCLLFPFIFGWLFCTPRRTTLSHLFSCVTDGVCRYFPGNILHLYLFVVRTQHVIWI
jgi:hypothetical protein